MTARLRAPGVAEGKEETLRATWICGCDGSKSFVRASAGIKFVGATYKELVRAAGAAVVCNTEFSTREMACHLTCLPLLMQLRHPQGATYLV